MAARMLHIGSAHHGHRMLLADRHGPSSTTSIIPPLPSARRNLGRICSASGAYAGLQPKFLSPRNAGNETSRSLNLEDDAAELRLMPQILAFSWVSVVWDIACGLLRLPATIWGLLTGNKSTIRELEEKVEKAAEFVKQTATKVEKTAEEVEKVAEIVAEDADKVEAMVDKVEKTSERMNEEMKQTVGDVKDSMDAVKEATESIEKTAQEVQDKGNNSAKISPPPSTSSTDPASSPASSDVSKFTSCHFQWLLLLLGPYMNPCNGLLIRYTIAFALTMVFLMPIKPSPLFLQA